MLRRRNDAKREQFHSQLSDGRCIAITVQPMPDGGTVTTHQDITEQRRSEAKIAHMALHDALTGLPNRVLLNDRLGHALGRANRGEMVAAHLLDLDHFKNVNDTLGHPAGDKLLKMVTDRLRGAGPRNRHGRPHGRRRVRRSSRWPSPSRPTRPRSRCASLRWSARPTTSTDTRSIIGTSVGIAVGPTDGPVPDDLMRSADLALYRAKADGRGTFRFFEPGMDARMQERRIMELELRAALAAQQFELHYQPVVDLATSTIKGFEALVRWHHPTRGTIAPGGFHSSGRGNRLHRPARRVGAQACLRHGGNVAGGLAGRRQPVARAVPQPRPGADHRRARSAASGLPPDQLELEITESCLLQNSEATLSTLFQLRSLGVRIAMDDFGTGYSSLSYLQSFPFDTIKIDRSFIPDVTEGVNSLNIVRAVAALANGLGMATIAEGVETQEQLETVRQEGCSEMQGFLFGRPLPAEEIEALYRVKRPPQSMRVTAA